MSWQRGKLFVTAGGSRELRPTEPIPEVADTIAMPPGNVWVSPSQETVAGNIARASTLALEQCPPR